MDAKTRGYCGTCHMAYQPSMLPASSWELMMTQLEDHFEEPVKLKPGAQRHITRYLVANAGDTQTAGQAGQIALAGLSQNARPQRISETPYFEKEHDFLKNRIIKEWVGSVANCTACHVGAWVGDYRSEYDTIK
ncbi:MAG: cytochrome C [Pseudomonadota bacterium]|nr:MAG: cytochrome C [Pseudomonadota bacterium]